MKKILTVLMVFGMMLGVSGFVLGDTGNSGVSVNIDGEPGLTISPTVLEFGSLIQGTVNNIAENPITFTPDTGANQDITVEIDSVDAGTLFELMEFEIGDTWTPIENNPAINLPCVLSGDIPICTYTPVNIRARLDVPSGYPSGIHEGTIVYTITGVSPSTS
jgi:hypothetical protein